MSEIAIPRAPQRMVCLTEGMTEWLYLLGQEARIVPRRPRVFFEEWDEPHVSAIRWSEPHG